MHMHVSTTLIIWRVSFLWIGCRKCKSKLCFALYHGIIRAAIFQPAMLCTKADAVADKAAKKLIKDMHYEARIQAAIQYHVKNS